MKLQSSTLLKKDNEKNGTIKKSASPFDILNNINKKIGGHNKEVENYIPFLTNRYYSFFYDTCEYANIMNQHSNLTPQQQYDFYYFCLERRTQVITKWFKWKITDKIKQIVDYYGYNFVRSLEVEDLIGEEDLKKMVNTQVFKNKGGIRKNGTKN